MDKPRTFINSTEGEVKLAYTSYPAPDSPFQLIDLDQSEIDFGGEIKKTLDAVGRNMRVLQDSILKLFEVVRDADEQTDVDIHLGSLGNNPSSYGHLSTKSIALLLVALSFGCKKNITFRSKKEGYQVIWNILVGLIEILGLDSNEEWDNLLHLYGVCGGVDFYSDISATEFRITALALKLMGQKNWLEFQEHKDMLLDDFGHVFVCEQDPKSYDVGE